MSSNQGAAPRGTRRQFVKPGQLAAAITKIYGRDPIMVANYMAEATAILPRLREMGLAYPKRFMDPEQKSSVIRSIAGRIGDHNIARGYSKPIKGLPFKDPQLGAKAAARRDPLKPKKKRTLSREQIQKMIDAKKAKAAARDKKAKATRSFAGQVTVKSDVPHPGDIDQVLSQILGVFDKWCNQLEAHYRSLLDKAESTVNEQQGEIADLRARLADVKSVLAL